MADQTVETSRQADTALGLFSGVVIGVLVGFSEERNPLVIFPGNPCEKAITARTTSVLIEAHIGRDVALLFEGGDPLSPIVVGPIQHATPAGRPATNQTLSAVVDGERILLSSDKEIVLKCGKASITLTRAGKILIRGTYLLSRSSGVNRVKGGVVHVN